MLVHTYHFTVSLNFNAHVLLERKVPLRLNYSKYGGQLTEDNLIRLAALLLDQATGDRTLAVRNIVLDNPEIKVRVSSTKQNSKLNLTGNLAENLRWWWCLKPRSELTFLLLPNISHFMLPCYEIIYIMCFISKWSQVLACF